MEIPEPTELLFQRIFELEPEYGSTIIEYVILNHNDGEMIRLAFSPETVLKCFIDDAKSDLGLLEASPVSIEDPYLPFFSYPRDPSSRLFLSQSYSDFDLQNPMQFLSLEDQFESVNPDGMGVTANRRCPFPVKACHYFSKGYCKHGSKCRYFHGQFMGENGNDERQVMLRGKALETLELEIVEILKSRRGVPISMASLPLVYYEYYGKNLQADGYLTESKRYGKAGYSLTKLLSSLNSIGVINRPRGQHSLILAEDAGNYIEFSESGARQIYITFPAESALTEQDISNYFNNFGPVQDVKIPCQQSMMYGFVTFAYAETAKHILSIRTTHFVCGARVLVKPYKEKLFQRKYAEKSPVPVGHIQNYMEGDLEEPRCIPRVTDGSLRSHLIDENDQQQQHSEFLLASQNSPHRPYLGLSTNELAHSSGNAEVQDFSSTDQQQHDFLPSLTDHPDDSTQELNLPDSPFAAPTTR